MARRSSESSHAEEPACRLLERLGWTYVSADVLAAERGGEREVLLKRRLTGALLRLNGWMTGEQADRVVFELEHLDDVGMMRNQAVHELLTYGMPLDVDTPDGRRSRVVRFFDFDSPEGGRNEFVVTRQFRVRRGAGGAGDAGTGIGAGSGNEGNTGSGARVGGGRVVVADLVLFVNGVPLVVMEAKAPTLVWRDEAISQMRRYQEAGPGWRGAGVPGLFHYNLLCVVHSGHEAAFGTLGAAEADYVEWKSVAPYERDEVLHRFGIEPRGQALLIIGLLSPAVLLDVLRDFVVYEPQRGMIVKKLPRYQQYRAVNAALRRMLTGRRPQERGGVIWHTQGSGKSLTMLWLATKLRREPRLGNPKIVVVTDRVQLDRQISDTFQRCGFPSPRRASSTRELRRLLLSRAGLTVMTTVQKFEEALDAPEGELESLDASANAVIMVDEAHRTQYGILGARMSEALPNAVLVGFTGTPIDKGFRRSTMGRFGPLIDSYTIPQSVKDGATVPIYYEARLPELSIEGPQTLDRLYDALLEGEPPEAQARIRRRYANKQTVAAADKRIQTIALDIADHYKRHIQPNGFKAQVVAPNRAAALRYARYLGDFGLEAYPIITTTPGDGPEFDPARGLDQQQVVNAFVDPQGSPRILVVVDMLLTGFDAPVEQVLYLDRPLREHGLLQAIARVNRRFSHVCDGTPTSKEYGLVVDYHGVSRDLEQALAVFESSDVNGAMHLLEEDPAPVMQAAAQRAQQPFAGLDLGDTSTCAAVFAPGDSTEGDFKEDLYTEFDYSYRQFSQLMDRFLPDPRAVEHLDLLARLTEIRAYVRAQFMREDASLNWTEIGAKVKKLVDQRINAEVRPLMKPVSVLDRDFDRKIAALPHDEARASMMEHAIRAHIHHRLAENPAFYAKLSEELTQIINALRQKLIDSAEASQRLAQLCQQIHNEQEIAAAHGLSPIAFAAYGLLNSQLPDSGSLPSRRIVRQRIARQRQNEEECIQRRCVRSRGNG